MRNDTITRRNPNLEHTRPKISFCHSPTTISTKAGKERQCQCQLQTFSELSMAAPACCAAVFRGQPGVLAICFRHEHLGSWLRANRAPNPRDRRTAAAAEERAACVASARRAIARAAAASRACRTVLRSASKRARHHRTARSEAKAPAVGTEEQVDRVSVDGGGGRL